MISKKKVKIWIKLIDNVITILKNTIQARRVTTGSMLTSLSGGSVRGVEKEILDIKETMSSILATLVAQEKFEMRKFLDIQRREENARRGGRETEVRKRTRTKGKERFTQT